MKIYQLHEYGGEYEDFRDYIIGSYLRKERAEEEKAKAEAKEERERIQGHLCNNCPFYDVETADELNDLLIEEEHYCDIKKVYFNEYGHGECANYTFHWDDMYFEIKEVEVEE